MADGYNSKCGEVILGRTKCNQNFLISHRTLVSRDNRLAICGCGNRLLVYSTRTGKLLRRLDGHETDVVDYHFRMKNCLQLISADKNGVIILWDVTDGTFVKKLKIQHSISALVTHPTNDDIIYVVKEEMKDKKNGRERPHYTLQQIDLSNPLSAKSKENEVVSNSICSISKSSNAIAFSQNGNVIAYIKNRKLNIVSLKDQYKRKFGFQGTEFLSVAFHPSRMLIATGNKSGKILLWSNFLNGETPTVVELNWHVHAVNTLSFTHDGLYLLSGGLESVLVLWQLSSLNKDFLPRMGAAIKFISISEDDKFVLVTLSNNVVKIISLLERHVVSILQGLSEVSNRRTDIKLDPRSGCLAIPVIPDGRLQFYNPENDSVLTTFDVVGQNYIVGPKMKAIIMSQIDHFDFNDDGSWLATIEHGEYKLIPDEVKLKFWRYDVTGRMYHLVTIAETPHDDPVTCLRLRPRPEASSFDEMAITAGKDGKIKFWVLEAVGNGEINEKNVTSWKCHSACSYGSSSCGKAAFSRDGSLLAVIYGKEITIWDSETGKLRTTFFCPVKDKFRDVVFGSGSSDPYLLTRTTHYVLCWNLLSCSMCWSIEAKVTALAVDPFSGYFAVFAIHHKEKNKLCLLDAATSKVVLRMGKGGSSFRVSSMAFSSIETVSCKVNDKTQKIGKLYALTAAKDIYKFGPKMEEGESPREFESLEEQVSSEFANIFGSLGKHRVASKTNLDTEEAFRTTPGNHSAPLVRKIIGTPSHVLPSVTSLSATFFKAVTLTVSPDLSNYESDEESENLDEDGKGSGSDEEPVIEKSNGVLTQDSVSFTEDDKTSTPGLTERTHKVNFSWITDFIASNYNS